MPACCLISASIPGSVGCTVGRRPFASRCLTQLPQQVQIADFHTSTELSIAAKAGEVQSIARDRAKTGRMAIGIFSTIARMTGFTAADFLPQIAIIVGDWRTGRNLVSYMRETCLAESYRLYERAPIRQGEEQVQRPRAPLRQSWR